MVDIICTPRSQKHQQQYPGSLSPLFIHYPDPRDPSPIVENMKLFAYIAVALPLVAAVAVPSTPEDDQMRETLEVIHGLLDDRKRNQLRKPLERHAETDYYTIEKIDLMNDQSLEKRWDVPGLHCGSKRAIRK